MMQYVICISPDSSQQLTDQSISTMNTISKGFFFLCSINIQTSVHRLCEMKTYTEQLPSDVTQLSSFSANIHRLEEAASRCQMSRATLHYTVLHCCGDTDAAGGIPFLPIATLPPPGSFYTCWGCKEEKCSASLTAVSKRGFDMDV